MRSVSSAWPPRLLAAAVALVLAVVHAIGAYAHAAGHRHVARSDVAGHCAAATDTASYAGDHGGEEAPDAGASAAPGHHHARAAADCGHGEDPAGHAHDACDTICHGGQAILVEAPVVPAPMPAAPSIGPVAALHGADSGGLDRPPKLFLRYV